MDNQNTTNVENTANEEVKGKATVDETSEVPVTPDHLATIPNLNPTNTEDEVKLENWIESLAKKSTIKNQMLCSKVVIIDKDKPTMWAMKLHFPGVTAASDVQAHTMDSEGNLSLGRLFKNAADAGVIVAPKFDDPETFLNTHSSAMDAGNEILNFLNSGVNGKLK